MVAHAENRLLCSLLFELFVILLAFMLFIMVDDAKERNYARGCAHFFH